MIKKLLGLLIIGISFICFSNAGNIQTVGLEESPSIYNTQYDLTFLKGGGLKTMFLGQAKSIIALSGNVLFWWTQNGQPYFQGGSGNNFQGYFGQYASCDELTGLDSTPTNCTFNDITGDYKTLFKNFFQNVKARDYVYYDYSPYSFGVGYQSYKIYMCFSSNTIGKSLCFIRHYSRASSASSTTNKGTLINSQNYNYTFTSIPQSEIGYAPGQAGYDGNRETPIETGNTNTNINNNYICPTIGQLMKNYGPNYNTGLCYNNTSYFNGTSFETVEQQDIFTIFNNEYQNYVNRISIYFNSCNTPATATTCQNAFSGEYKKYSIIANATNSNVDQKYLWNYCNMGLNYDPNATTCVVGTGYLDEPPTIEDILEDIIDDNINIPTPSKKKNTGDRDNVFKSLCDEENDENCFGTGDIRNVFEKMDNIYQKITGLFKERKGVNGIIPNYIIRITFITILFTVIFKK